jgi:hypothetical protein
VEVNNVSLRLNCEIEMTGQLRALLRLTELTWLVSTYISEYN